MAEENKGMPKGQQEAEIKDNQQAIDAREYVGVDGQTITGDSFIDTEGKKVGLGISEQDNIVAETRQDDINNISQTDSSASEGTGTEGTDTDGTGSEGTGTEGTGADGTGSEATGTEGTGADTDDTGS